MRPGVRAVAAAAAGGALLFAAARLAAQTRWFSDSGQKLVRKTIPETSWVKAIAGVSEGAIRANPGHYIQRTVPDEAYASVERRLASARVNPAGMSDSSPPPFLRIGTFNAGQFSLFRLGTLRRVVNDDLFESVDSVQSTDAASQDALVTPRMLLPLELLVRSTKDDVRAVDVAYLQAHPSFDKACFQVASNFNGVEAISEESTPDASDFVTKYTQDWTQGPAASISAGAGALVRVLCVFPPSTEQEEAAVSADWAQTATRQIDLLADVKNYIRVRNGYADLANTQLLPDDTRSRQKILDQILVGYHRSQTVTTGHWARQFGTLEAVAQELQEQSVDQVFAAAINCAQGYTGRMNARSPGARNKMNLVLDAAYEGAYLACVANGRAHLVLTIIGGGVFGNPVEDVLNSLARAHKLWGHQGSSLRKVSLVLYDDSFRTNPAPVTELFATHHIETSVNTVVN